MKFAIIVNGFTLLLFGYLIGDDHRRLYELEHRPTPSVQHSKPARMDLTEYPPPCKVKPISNTHGTFAWLCDDGKVYVSAPIEGR